MIEPFFDGGAARVYHGHALDVLRTMPDESAHMAVTSPPYWGLRAYETPPIVWDSLDTDCQHEWETERNISSSPQRDHSGGVATGATGTRGKQSSNAGRAYTATTGSFCSHCTAWRGHLGLEPFPELYIEHLVTIFREVRRVLRRDGTLWIVVGDTYAGYHGNSRVPDDQAPSNKSGYIENMRRSTVTWRPGNPEKNQGVSNRDGVDAGPKYKPKDAIGIPWMLAFALRADGWYLRSEIIWEKPDCMPESVTDRPTKAHETVFLLAKSKKYFYDTVTIQEPNKDTGWQTKLRLEGREGKQGNKANIRSEYRLATHRNPSGRNKRSVWTIPTEAYAGAHFAVFPSALARVCILAGSSQKGCCAICGVPWERVTKKTRTFESGSGKAGHLPVGKSGPGLQGGGETKDIRRGPVVHSVTTGWRPMCACQTSETVPAVVLDPFAGTGTSLLVARSLGRHAIGIELSEKYCDLIIKRVGEPYQEEGESAVQVRLLPRQPSVFDP